MTCTIEGCDKPAKNKGLCNKHYYRIARYGDPHKSQRISAGELRIDIKDGYADLYLTTGQIAKIDIDDIPRVKDYCWSAKSKERGNVWYIRGYVEKRNVVLSRYLMDAPKGMVVDHINHDPFDNRKSNLRICTHTENLWNLQRKSHKNRFKGISYRKNEGRWVATICKNAKHYYLGAYKTDVEAARAYDKKAIELFGEYAKVNEYPTGLVGWKCPQ